MLAPGEQDMETRVIFGDAPGNSLTLAVVEQVLRLWHSRDPETMGAYVGEAICGAVPRAASRRNRAG